MKGLYICLESLVVAAREKAGRGEDTTGTPHHLSYATNSSDAGLCFFSVEWPNWRDKERFEVQAGVIPLGEPYEPLPAEAVPYFESARQAAARVRDAEAIPKRAKTGLAPTADVDAPIDGAHTVGQAFKKAFPQGFGR